MSANLLRMLWLAGRHAKHLYHLQTWSILHRVYCTLHPGFTGSCPKIDGPVTWRVHPCGEVVFGDGVRMNSSGGYNPMSAHRKCVIYVARGARCEIGPAVGLSGCTIVCTTSVVIGRGTLIGACATILDSDMHAFPLGTSGLPSAAPINVGESVFIGAYAVVLKGVTIGSHSIVASASVVTKDIPQRQLWGGNPARYIKAL